MDEVLDEPDGFPVFVVPGAPLVPAAPAVLPLSAVPVAVVPVEPEVAGDVCDGDPALEVLLDVAEAPLPELVGPFPPSEVIVPETSPSRLISSVFRSIEICEARYSSPFQ